MTATPWQSHYGLYSGRGFLERDPAAVAAEADLGEDGAAEITAWQEFYRQLFEKVGDEGWPHEPLGPLASHWRGLSGAQSTYYLINMANRILDLVLNASPPGITGSPIKQRLRMLLRPPDEHSYEETLVELEVGGMIAPRISPLLLEPLVPAELRGSPSQPTSPDYGVRVPEGLVTVEVTVWHWGPYAAWRRMYDMLHQTLSTRVLKRGISRRVDIELPLRSPQEVVKRLWSYEFCQLLSDQDFGNIEIPVGPELRPIVVTWRPLLQPAIEAASSGRLVSLYWFDGHAFAMSVNPGIGDEDRESALASLRRSIDRKKRQCDPKLPHFLAISPLYPHTVSPANELANTWDVFDALIEDRIWPNALYSWLSGILECTPNRAARSDGPNYFIGYNPNPNAAVPAPETLMRAMTGQAEFHTMWQRPSRTKGG